MYQYHQPPPTRSREPTEALSSREIDALCDRRLKGPRARAPFTESLQTGWLDLPRGYCCYSLLDAWMTYCIRKNHPEVYCLRKKVTAFIRLTLHHDPYGERIGLQLTKQGHDLIRPIALAAECRRDSVISCRSGVAITAKIEDAELVCRQFLDVALEHHKRCTPYRFDNDEDGVE